MKKCILLLPLLLVSFFGISQDNDAYKKFVNTTLITINQAQKQMSASGKTDQNGLLAKAALLQANAIKLYKASNKTRAVCSSALARQYAAEIIKNIRTNVNALYLIHDDEKVLINNCATENDLYNESKSNFPQNSALDKDYIKIEDLNNITNF